MRLSHEQKDNTLVISLDGELGHHEAMQSMNYIGNAIEMYNPSDLELDLSGLSFMDSSGIAVVLSAYKNMSGFGGNMAVTGIREQAKKVLHAAGIDRIVKII